MTKQHTVQKKKKNKTIYSEINDKTFRIIVQSIYFIIPVRINNK